MDEKIKAALEAVIREAPDVGYNEYGKTYANTALNNPRTGEPMKGHELKVQLLYVLNNLQYWKGDRAKEIKAILKKAAKS